MTSRTILSLVGIIVVVAGLSAYRSAGRVEPQGPPSSPLPGPAVEAPGEGGDAGSTPVPPASPLPRVLDFGRGECIPCKKMKPVLDELAARWEGKVIVRIYDLKEEESRNLAETHGVRLIPTQVFLDGEGKERFRHEGFLSLEDMEAELARLGWTR